MFQNTCQSVAPSMRAESSSSWGKFRKNCRTMIRLKALISPGAISET
jgi:hypothetical protein